MTARKAFTCERCRRDCDKRSPDVTQGEFPVAANGQLLTDLLPGQPKIAIGKRPRLICAQCVADLSYEFTKQIARVNTTGGEA